MSRYLRLYTHFIKFSLSKAFEFRLDFWIHCALCLIYAGAILGFYKVLYSHTDSIGGWNAHEAQFLIAAWLIVDAIQNAIISSNLEELPLLVNKGSLDYYLVRPVSSLFFVSLREFSAQAWVDVFIAVAVLIGAILNYPEYIPLWKYAVYFLLVLNGVFVFYLIRAVLILPVFWFHNAEGLSLLFWSFHRAGERPDRIYHGVVRTILVSVLPFCLIASFPTRLLIEEWSWNIFLHLVGVTVLLFTLLLVLWQKALRAYSSASS